MSRIYQGGQSESSYQARDKRKGYNPVQALSNQQAIIQEGESQMRALKTQEREAQRSNSMSDLERQSQDAADRSTLQMEQQRANHILKQKELIENAELQTAELAAQGKQKMSQTTERGQVSIDQLADKNILKLNEIKDRGNLKLAQMLSSNELKSTQDLDTGLLKLAQTAQSNALKQTQLGERLALDYVNKAETSSQNLEFKEANYLLSSEQNAQKADMQLAQQHMQLSNQVDNANTRLLGTTINSLINFGSSVATHVGKQQEKARQEEIGRAQFDSLFETPVVSADGVVSPAISNETALRNVEVAEEQAIQQVAPGDTITQEALRQPGADQSMLRAESQAYVSGSALDLSQRLADLVDSNPTVLNGQGQPVPLSSLRTSTEYASGVKQLVRGLYDADGISRGDSYAGYMAYGKAARGAYNSQVQSGTATLRARVKQERYDAGLAAGTALAVNGQAQAGWDTSITNAQGSGNFDNKSWREINTQTLKDHVSRLPRERIKDMLSVRKIGSQAGTEFGNSPEYRKIIMDAYNGRIADENRYFSTQQTAQTNEVKEITQSVTMALMADGLNGEQSLAIRQEAIGRLQEIGTPQALDAAQTLREKGGNNQSVYLGFVEGFEGGYPPTSAELAAARADDSISHEQLQDLKKMGLRSDQIVQAMEKAGLPSAEKQLKNMISMRLGALGVDSTERSVLASTLSAQLLPEAKARFNNFLNQQPPPNSLQIQQESNKIMQDMGKQLYDPANPDLSMVKFDAGTGFAEVRVEAYGRTTTRKNPTTGKFQTNYIRVKPENIPSTGISVNDAYLSKDTFLESVELWDKGRPAAEYPKRVRDIAAKLGVSPTSFIRSQAQALGYPSIEKVSPAIESNPPTNMKSGFNALQSMGFPTRGAAYLSGNIMQESGWNGARSWGEVANDGSDRNGGLVSWMDGVAHNNFRLTKIEDYLGKGIAQASPSEQLQAMQWEMKKDYPNAYRTFMNPNATYVQLERASREYWGYGHEGERYTFAQSLLR